MNKYRQRVTHTSQGPLKVDFDLTRPGPWRYILLGTYRTGFQVRAVIL